jgi:hypothetical protein
MSCSTCNNKNCNNSSLCGCKDTYLTSPLPCPTPVACPDRQPCSETFDAECIVYTGPNLQCGSDDVVLTNTSINLALEDIITYFCQELTALPTYDIVAGAGITITETILGTLTTFTVASKAPVKFVKEFTSSLDGVPVTITAAELATCGIPTTACNTNVIEPADFTYSISYLDGTTWYNITNVDTVLVSTSETSGDVRITLAVPSSGDPKRVRVTIIG